MSDSKPDVYEDEKGRIVYRASSLGGCLKRLAAVRMGYTQLKVPGKMMKVFEAGHQAEVDCVKALEQDKMKVYDRQQEVGFRITQQLLVKGHIDGTIFDRNNDQYLLEVKSMNDEAWTEFVKHSWDTPGLVQKYKWQCSIYMLAKNLPLYFAAYNRDTDDVFSSIVLRPFVDYNEIAARVLTVEGMALNGNLPKECEQSFPCPVAYLHDQLPYELIDDEELDNHCIAYAAARIKRDASEAEMKGIRELIIKLMGDKEKVETSKAKVSMYEVRGAEYLDREALAKVVDLEEYTKRRKSHTNLRVTLKEDNASPTDAS